MEKPRCWEDEGEGRGKSPKVEMVTSSRTGKEKLEGRAGVKYPIKKMEKKKKSINWRLRAKAVAQAKLQYRYCSTEGKRRFSSVLW